MKRITWIIVMVAICLTAATSRAPVSASGFIWCEDMTCKYNNDCTPQCSGCDNPSPIFPGNCEVRF